MSLTPLSSLNRRRFLGASAATALASALPISAQAATPKRGGHLRAGLAHGSTTDTLNPATWATDFDVSLAYAVHGHLTQIDAAGTVQPALAESWEASPDAKEWRIKLRTGVTYHSGAAVTLDDVLASINFHRGADSTSAAAPLVADIEDITAEGDDTVVFTLAAGNADFPFILSDYHLPVLKADGDAIDWKSGDGCGSYILKEFKPGISCTLERNPNHWDSSVGWFDSVEILTLADLNARTTALVSGDVDVVNRLDLKTVGLLGRRPGVNIHSVAGTMHYTFTMITEQDPFTDNHVRMALKYGVNRTEMVEKILFGYGAVGNDHPIGSGQRFFNTELEQRSYDPDKAKWHLSQAGMDNLAVTLSAADAAFSGAVDAAVLYQNSAKAAGIEITPLREPNDGYWSDVWMKKPFSAVYWSGRPTEDQMFSMTYKSDAAWNDSFWKREAFDEMLLKARSELNDTTRRQLYFDMQEMVSNDGGVVIPMFANYVFASSDKIGLPDQLATNWDIDGQRWIERWWFA